MSFRSSLFYRRIEIVYEILACEKAIQLANGTSVVLLRCPFMSEITARKGT
jgi:hypothetical protein